MQFVGKWFFLILSLSIKQSELKSFSLTVGLVVCMSLQCLHPRGEWPVSTRYSDRLPSAFPWGSGTGLGPAQPLLDRLGWQDHLCGFSGWQQETRADQHRSERTTSHRCGSRERVSSYQTHHCHPTDKTTKGQTAFKGHWDDKRSFQWHAHGGCGVLQRKCYWILLIHRDNLTATLIVLFFACNSECHKIVLLLMDKLRAALVLTFVIVK